MAIPSNTQKVQRREPAHRRLLKNPALARMWSDGDLASISPDDPITNEVISGAVVQAGESVRPLQERKTEAMARRREARTASGQAAARLLGQQEESVEVAEAEQTKAQAQALVSQMTPEELEAVEEAMIQRAAKAAQEAMSEGEREAATLYQAEQAAAARVTADLGFDPNEPPAGEVWNDADIEETGLEWRDELDGGEVA